MAVTGNFTGANTDEAAIFAFVLEGPIADAVMFPASVDPTDGFGVPILSLAGAPTSMSPTGIATKEAFGSPSITLPPPPQTMNPFSTMLSHAFGAPSTSVPTQTLEGPATLKLQAEWWAIPTSGNPYVLPEVTNWEISGIAGTRGSISVETVQGTALHDTLFAATVLADKDLEVEIRLFGGSGGALRGFLLESEADEITEQGTRKFSGTLLAQRMYEALVYPNPLDEKGETRFAAKNAGQMVATLMQTAQARGALTDISTFTFNSSTDSNGVAWNLITTATFSPGSPYGEVLEELEELGLCEWELTPQRELKLYVPGTRGTDRTGGATPTVLFRGRDMLEADRKHSVRDSVTALLTGGKEGLYHEEVDATALARRGRRIEGYETSNNLETVGALTAYAQGKLLTLTPGAVEITHALVVNGTGPQPFLDLKIGDLVWSDTGKAGGTEQVRVQQLSLSQNGDTISSSAVVGTLSTSFIVALKRRLDRLERGDSVVGTSVSGGFQDDTTPPAQPKGLVASSIAYQDPSLGGTLCAVTASWLPVTTDEGGMDTAQSEAARLIYERISSGAPYDAVWSWTGAPAIVDTYNDIILAEYAASGATWTYPPTDTQHVDWLKAYVAAHTSVGTATNDVKGYRVRYAYVGLNQVGGIPSSDPFPEDDLSYIEATGVDGTAQSTFTFDGVGAGVEVRVEVQAFDTSNNASKWSDPYIFTTVGDTTPPPVPAQPTVAPWFGTIRITWNGLGSAGEVMPADFDHIEVHVSQVFNFVPSPSTFQANMYAAGVWNVSDLPYGIGEFVRFVAVDASGNASAPSANSDMITPEQLVSQDLIDSIITAEKIADFAVGSAKIVDAAIITAKIADLAVNDAKVAFLSVGKLTAGNLSADVLLSGSIRTATTGPRVEMDAAGLRLYNPLGQLVVRFGTSDGTALITGTYQSGLAGERINIFPDGTLRFYPAAGANYSQIANFGNDVVWRGPLDAQLRSGRFNVNVLGCGMNFSAESEIPNALRAEIVVFDRNTRITAPVIDFRLDGKLPTKDGSGRRIQFYGTNSAGVNIGPSFLFYVVSNTNSGALVGNGGGLKFEAGKVLVTTGDDASSFGTIQASDFITNSSLTIKHDVRPLRKMRDVVLQARGITFRYLKELEPDQREHVGLAVEHVEPLLPNLVIGQGGPANEKALTSMGVATVAWEAAAEAHEDIAIMKTRLEELSRRLDAMGAV